MKTTAAHILLALLAIASTHVRAQDLDIEQFLSLNCTPGSFGDSFDPPTAELVVECTSTNISVTSMSIDILRDGRLVNLANYDEGVVTVTAGAGVTAVATGALDVFTVTIASPGPVDASVYFCTAKGPERIRTVRRRVFYVAPPIDEITERIEQNTEDIQTLEAEIANLTTSEAQANFTDDIEDLKACKLALEISLNDTIDRLEGAEVDISLLQCQANITRAYVDSIDAALFEISDVHNGNRYILSDFTPASFVSAQEFCNSRNGTLAEIDDSAELTFVRDFLLPRISYTQNVLTGAIRSGDGASFVNAESGTTAFTEFFNSTDPTVSFCEDCVALAYNLFGEDGIKNIEVPCQFIPLFPQQERAHAFLCEVADGGLEANACTTN